MSAFKVLAVVTMVALPVAVAVAVAQREGECRYAAHRSLSRRERRERRASKQVRDPTFAVRAVRAVADHELAVVGYGHGRQERPV